MYPYLKECYEIHYFADDGFLTDIDIDISFRMQGVEIYVFEKINGLNTRDDIIAEIINEFPENTTEDIVRLVDNILKGYNNYIEYSSDKIRKKVIFTGVPHSNIPKQLSIEMVDKCVYECIHCYNHSEISKNTYINTNKLLDSLRYFSGKIMDVQLTGGECMLHPNFFQILDFCQHNFARVIVSTTGALINKDNVRNFKDVKVYLSLYSIDEKKNNIVTNNSNSYKKTLDAVKLLVTNGIHVCVNFLLTELNYQEIEQVINLMLENGVNSMGLGTLVKVGRGDLLNDNWYLSDKRLTVISQYVNEIISNYEDKIDINKLEIENDRPKTDLLCGKYQWVLKENGDILPCAFMPAEQFKLGNLNTQSIQEIVCKSNVNNFYEKSKIFSKQLSEQGKDIKSICPALYSWINATK